MKQKTARVIILILVLAMTFSAVMAGCGKKIEAGDYSGSIIVDHPLEVEIPAFGPSAGAGPTKQMVEKWGADVTITVDEDGIIWDVVANAPEGATMTTSAFMWGPESGKFIGSFTGNYSCADMMDVKVDTEADGFPILTGDCGGIHLADKDMTLLNDYEVTCALVILAIQDAIVSNGLN